MNVSGRFHLLLARCAVLLISSLSASTIWSAPTVEEVRVATQADAETTRVVLVLNEMPKQKVFMLGDPSRVVVDLTGTNINTMLPEGTGVVKTLRAARRDNGDLRLVLDVSDNLELHSSWLEATNDSGPRLVLDLAKAGVKHDPTANNVVAASEPQPVRTLPSNGTNPRDLVIAVDAGHGGEDPGAIGRRGTREKNVTLAIARLLKERIDAEPGMHAVLTRDGDYFVPLRDRIDRARQLKADMFISIHADSVGDSSVTGSSVYTLSGRGATNEAARILADRENAADLVGGVSLDNKNSLLASVLLDLTQGASMSASLDAAARVLQHLDAVGDVHHSGVQQAGFVVLKSPDIPSMLVETAFISNRAEEARLANAQHQAQLADAILAGVHEYFYTNTPPGTRLAQLKATRQARNN